MGDQSMSTVAARPPIFSTLRRTDLVMQFVLLFVALGCYLVARKTFELAGSTPSVAAGTVVFTAAAALPFANLRYRDVPRFISIFVRWIAIAVVIQVAFDAFGFAPGVPNVLFDGGPGLIFFRYAAILALAAGILGLWRPAFLVALFGYYEMFRHLAGEVSHIHMVKTDFGSMLDTGSFALIGTLSIIALTHNWTAARVPLVAKWHERFDVAEVRKNAILLVWSGAVGAHLANYFWSGMAKVQAGWPEPWTWWLHNPTQTSILMGLERGDNLLWAFPGLLNLIWHAFILFALPLNTFVLGAQLASPAAAVGKRTLLTFTVFFDIFHVVVWFTLGALFQYWVLVNLLIFASAQHLGIKKFTNPMRLVMAGMTLLAPFFFYVNHLGWLDAAKLPSTHFLAKTRDGRLVPVPGPFFGIFAYNIAQNRLYVPDGAFPNWQAGNHKSLMTWRDGIACGPMRAARQKQYTSLQAVRDMVERTDAFARAHPWYKTMNTYYYYPHHMLPNPAHYKEFNGLSIDDITGYTYRVDSVCLDLKGGVLQRDVRDRWEYQIPATTAAGK
jgi:hypothetical protein